MQDEELGTYHVDVTAPNNHTYQVKASSQDEARERYSEGIIVNSETGSPEIVSVVRIGQS